MACWTDYSKELEIKDQETCKSSAFGQSNVTIQLIGQVFEMKASVPSQPTSLTFQEPSQILSFSSPVTDGGSHIQNYEIHIKSESETSVWQNLSKVNVSLFSSHPEVPTNLFGRLGGRFLLRIFARNLVGVSPCSEILVHLSGDLPLMEVPEADISSEFFDQMHTTFFVEHFFFSDHQDAPKVKL